MARRNLRATPKGLAIVFLAAAATVLAVALLLSVTTLRDSTRAAADLAELKTFAFEMALTAHGSGEDLESTILVAEARGAEITAFAAQVLGPDKADPYIDSIKAAWFLAAAGARAYVPGQGDIDSLADLATRTGREVDALINVIEQRSERDLRTVQVLLAAGIAALGLAGAGAAVALSHAYRRATAAKLREWVAGERIRDLTDHDSVTGLLSRERFRTVLSQQLERGPVALINLELSRFHRVAEALGDDASDAVLREAATRLRDVEGDDQALMRRQGAEFMLLSDVASLHSLSRSILEVLAQPFAAGADELVMSATIGFAVADEDAQSADRLIELATAARLCAQQRGRGTAHRFGTECVPLRGEIEMESELQGALERDEFVLHYQPQIDLRTGAVCGVEALLRWQSPTRGLVPPDAFIPLLEASGLIVPVGEWVLRTACRQTAEWRTLPQARSLKVAVNISPRQLQDNLLPIVERALADSRLPSDALEVELTETAALDDLERASQFVDRLRAAGVAVALDDFGTGQSSLTHLRRLKVSVLKVDRSFVSGVADDAADYRIVSGILSLAHDLGLQVVAEGVETEAQMRELKSLQCDVAQGYLLGRPQPPDQLETRLRDGARLAA